MITIVTHCWAVQKPQYAVFLRCQLSSLVTYRPAVPFRHVVCHSASNDPLTAAVLEDFSKLLPELSPQEFDTQHLWRRAIGRNTVAKADTDSDLIWFCDSDYLMLAGCVDTICAGWEAAGCPTLVWPKSYMATVDKDVTDRFCIEHENARGLLMPDLSEGYAPKASPRAIGGLQIIRGDYMREFGYLGDDKYKKRLPSIPFPEFRDDVVFRSLLTARPDTEIAALPHLPSLYRLRHSEVGYAQPQPRPR